MDRDSKAQTSSGQQAQVALEQRVVDRAYATLDGLREYYRRQQRRVAAQSSVANHSARTQRDVLAAHYGDEAARLEQVENRLVFGKLSMDGGQQRYIGRIGLRHDDVPSGEGRSRVGGVDDGSVDGVGRQLLVDWRAPAARPFYQATALSTQGVRQRRHILTHLRKVVGVEDELLDLADSGRRSDSSSLQGEGALMAAMAAPRSGHMSDIVSTIQSEQDAIIRSDLDAFLVVQGGPGTGKTAVALHRAAYLLYANRERLDRSGVLVVGPSRLFLRYIEQVLPALGETGVVAMTLGQAFPGVPTVVETSGSLRAIKGRLEWLEVARAAVARLQRLPKADQLLQVGPKQVLFSVQMAREAMDKARGLDELHNVAWHSFASSCLEALVEQFVDDPKDKEESEWALELLRSVPQVRRTINSCWLPASAQEVLERLYAYPQLLEQVAEGFSAAQRRSLVRPKGSSFTDADVPILDELAELLGPVPPRVGQVVNAEQDQSEWELARAQEAIESQDLGGGLVSAQLLAQRAAGPVQVSALAQRARQDREWTYGHVVVDEAQELTAMDWHLLLRRCPSLSFTVVGDIDQRSLPVSADSWLQALGPARRAEPVVRTLTVNYRTPAQVMDLAQAVLRAAGRPVADQVTSARQVPEALRFTLCDSPAELAECLPRLVKAEREELDQRVGSGQGRICVVGVEIDEYQQVLSHFLDTAEVDVLSAPLSVLSPIAVKGLEFDTVIVVDPARIAQQSLSDLYVCLTRPTGRLHVVTSEGETGLVAGMRTDDR